MNPLARLGQKVPMCSTCELQLIFCFTYALHRGFKMAFLLCKRNTDCTKWLPLKSQLVAKEKGRWDVCFGVKQGIGWKIVCKYCKALDVASLHQNILRSLLSHLASYSMIWDVCLKEQCLKELRWLRSDQSLAIGAV